MGYSPMAVKTPDVSSSAAKNEDDEKKGKQRKGSSWVKKIISRRFYFTSKVTDSMSSEDEDDILINNPAMDGDDNDDDHPHESSLSTFPSSLDLLSEEEHVQSGEGSQRSVSFSELHVRQHDVVLGDHPCCYTGLPVALGWHIREEYSTTIDEFESKRRTERRASREDLRLSEDERRSMLLSLSSSSKKENDNDESNTCASHDNEKKNDETTSIDQSSSNDNIDENNYNEQKLRRVERKLCRERRKNRSKYCQRQEETQFFQQKVSS